MPAIALGHVAPRTLRTPVEWAPLVIADSHCKGCELCVDACPKAVRAVDRTRVTSRRGATPNLRTREALS
jgi:ferredoxin